MKKLIGGLVAGAALAFAAATAQAETVKVGVAAEPYPPYSSKDASGTWVGWEIDMYKAACKAAGLDCQL
ncbi:MAG TPA: transporter substrate-binding domain-containing protein, partial [Dongiaceae bacterium]|nr:transporter substrate-binding domain-containing protein [Dongiaceae bacterium]